MRKLGIAITVLVVLIIAALSVVPHFIDVNTYRGRIQAELQQRLNRPVILGQMHLSLLPPKFMVDNVEIGEDPQFHSDRPFATVQQLAISVKLLPLLHKDVQVSSLDLQRPHVELIRDAQGVWNFSTIGQAKPQAPAPTGQQQPSEQHQPSAQQQGQPQPPQQAPQQSQKSQKNAPPAIGLDNLQITDGQMALTDFQKHQSRAVYDHIDAGLKNFAPDKQFDLSLAAHLPGKGTQTMSLAGKAGPINNTNMISTPFNGTLKLNQVSLDGVQKFLNTQTLANMAGVISGAASVKNQDGTVASDGSLKIDQAVVRGVNIGYPISLDYKVADDLKSDIINISQGNIRLGSTPLAIAGTVNTRATPAQVNVKLNAKDVSLTEAARLAAAFGVAFNANTKVDGRASVDIAANGPANKPALNGTVAGRDLSVSGQGIPAPVKIPAVDLALTPQQVRSNPFTATAGNTSLNGQFTLTNYTSPNPAVDGTMRTSNAQIADLLSMARASGVSAANDMNGSGLLTLDVHATGPIKDTSAMTFNGTGQVHNASLKTATLKAPLNVRNANLQFSNNGAQVQNLAASIGQTDAAGQMTVRNFSAPNVQFNLTANKVNVTELQQITGTAPATNQPPQPKMSEINLVPRAQAEPVRNNAGTAATASILNKMTGGGTVQIGTVQNDQLVLTNVRSNVTLDRGIVTLSPLTAQLYGGSENGAITIDTRTTPMTIQAKSNLQQVQANNLISAVSSVKNTIYGLLAANTQANFQAANANDIAHTLNGTLAVNLNNGRITKLDLLNQLAAVGKFAGVRKNAQAVTDVAKLAGHFNVRNGVATTNDLRADIAGGTLAADGLVNLATRELNLHVTAVLSKGFTQQMGGTGSVGGLMQTALANNRGELVIPVIITGTFDQPQVAPDVQKVAQMKLQNLLPTTGDPGALSAGVLGNVLKGATGGNGQTGGVAGSVLGALTGQQQNQPAQQQGQQPVASPQQQQQQPADAVNQALQGILGGKKKQQQKPPPK